MERPTLTGIKTFLYISKPNLRENSYREKSFLKKCGAGAAFPTSTT